MEAEHPRWGSIMCVQSQRPIKAGEEIFANYHYKIEEPPYDHPWYFEQQRKFEEEEAEEMRKKYEKDKIKKIKKKKKTQKST